MPRVAARLALDSITPIYDETSPVPTLTKMGEITDSGLDAFQKLPDNVDTRITAGLPPGLPRSWTFRRDVARWIDRCPTLGSALKRGQSFRRVSARTRRRHMLDMRMLLQAGPLGPCVTTSSCPEGCTALPVL